MFVPWIHYVQEDEQLLVEGFTERKVINGPAQYISRPFEKVSSRKGIRVAPTEYLKIANTLTGDFKAVKGPCLYFLDATEELIKQETALTLTEDQYALILNPQTGNLRSIQGPQLYFPSAVEEVIETKSALSLRKEEYAFILDKQTGDIRSLQGPQRYFPTATETIIDKLKALPLKENEYIRILNKTTGQVKVVQGETTVYLSPSENIIGNDVNRGINIDDETAVVIRDRTTGQQSLVTEHQVFIPKSNQKIVNVQKRIRLEDHETVIIKDKDGRYIFRYGRDEERAFFLDPYSELVTLRWSSGLHKEKRELTVTHIDSRPKYMWYEFEVRTKDNVELVIGITFFWQIVDVEAMIRMTDDTAGDICSHARSTIIQAVSRVTLEYFLDNFNLIVRDGTLGDEESEFYSQRGVQINAVEVRSVTCKDPQTQEILMEIIQETTNRLNRLQKQESENEVRLKELQGQIETENARGELLSARREHTKTEATTKGESEAESVRQFIVGLGDDLTIEDKVKIYTMLRKGDVLHSLSQGKASLYFTPADVDLSIETK